MTEFQKRKKNVKNRLWKLTWQFFVFFKILCLFGLLWVNCALILLSKFVSGAFTAFQIIIYLIGWLKKHACIKFISVTDTCYQKVKRFFHCWEKYKILNQQTWLKSKYGPGKIPKNIFCVTLQKNIGILEFLKIS